MRIECDNCSAKYSIADEKVIGKLFKVRCKKCSNMIMVDGTTLGGDEEPEEATRVFDPNTAQAEAEASMAPSGAATSAAVWYVVIDGQQTGPLTFAEVQGHAGDGALDAQTFAWREGMDDWLPIADIPDLAAAASGPPPAAAAPAPAPAPAALPDDDDDDFEDEATRVVSSSDEAGAFSFGGVTGGQSSIDSFSAPAPAAAPAAAPAPAAPSGGDMFAGVSSGASSGAAAVAPSQAQSAAASSGAGMVGERNESSVLFSLSDLTSSRSAQPKQDELPRTEGSGLIDIRVLAQAQSQVGDAGQAAAAPVAAAASSMPVTPLVPVAPRRRNTGLMVGIGLGVIVILGLFAVVVVLMTQDDPEPVPVVVADNDDSEDESEGSADDAVAAVDEGTGDEAEEGSGDEVAVAEGSGEGEGSGDALAAAEGSGEGAEGDPEGEGGDDAAGTQVAAATNTNTAPTPSRDTAPTTNNTRPSTNTAPPSRDSTPPSRDDSAERPRGDDAVNSALAAIRGGDDDSSSGSSDSGSTGSTDSTPPAAAGPTELSRSQVQSTVRRYRSRLESCRTDGGARQQYDFRWVIQPSGSVTNAQARQSDDVAQCAVGVIRAMQFPRFNGDAQRIPAYPMQL